jgi:manganese transport protein
MSTSLGIPANRDSKRLSMRVTLGLLGPAFVAAIAYVDPGNFATNISAGSLYGYLLLWVIVAANLMASQVQYLSAKLGLVTGQSLPELLRYRLSNKARIAYWAQAELVAVATDIAEVLGGAIALQLLFNLPLIIGGVITGLVSIVLLLVRGKRGQKTFERMTLGLLLIVPIGFIAGLILKPPHVPSVLHGLIPAFNGQGSLLLATGIIGATVMPHAIYLHSALSRDRHGKPEDAKLAGLLKATRLDVGVAMCVAGSVNALMLILAASALKGVPGTSTIEGAYTALGKIISPEVAFLFAVGLLASGLAATTVGCYAGSVIMGDLLKKRIPLITRRVITLIPALVIIAIGYSPTSALVLSQVVLSFTLPFAIIPLIKLTSSRPLMGRNVNSPVTTAIAWLVTIIIISLNFVLIARTL